MPFDFDWVDAAFGWMDEGEPLPAIGRPKRDRPKIKAARRASRRSRSR